MVVVAGDMNGHVGNSNVGYSGIHGRFGCGCRNVMDQDFCNLQMG